MAAHKKASLGVEVLLMLILVVMISAVILFLIKSGMISVKASGSEEPILNTEFIPLEREGVLTLTSFSFCRYVDSNYRCLQPLERFPLGADVYFIFTVESSTENEKVILIENYKLKNPQGIVILDVDARNDFYVESTSEKKNEEITFKDYFITDLSLEEGVYTLELHLENPILAKNVKATKKVELFRK
ncbi:hypothetical protein J4421_00565 [Candidatus Woesearchaeota archaeon]|nr:hypothetical protein [Candidatus Woesearchaeota archaeon]